MKRGQSTQSHIRYILRTVYFDCPEFKPVYAFIKETKIFALKFKGGRVFVVTNRETGALACYGTATLDDFVSGLLVYYAFFKHLPPFVKRCSHNADIYKKGSFNVPLRCHLCRLQCPGKIHESAGIDEGLGNCL